MRTVVADHWLAEVEAARADGYRFFDWLGGVDQIGRSDTLRIVLALRRLDAAATVELWATDLPRDEPRLPTIRGVFAGAAWHEREAAELFGVEFVGGDQRRLLLSPGFVGTPLRKDQVLAARTGMAWPGAKEPGESEATRGSARRRRLVPPGVPDPSVWGDRDEAEPAADPAAVADALTAGRARRLS
ncbi:MAG TPA: NADH-quinone oxidoreductase subunit C [Propionibacteriaceae bacterium]|nr:NADH-quinone oxidoreductase subunit C [Propionibacteriaceae bacterium]